MSEEQWLFECLCLDTFPPFASLPFHRSMQIAQATAIPSHHPSSPHTKELRPRSPYPSRSLRQSRFQRVTQNEITPFPFPALFPFPYASLCSRRYHRQGNHAFVPLCVSDKEVWCCVVMKRSARPPARRIIGGPRQLQWLWAISCACQC